MVPLAIGENGSTAAYFSRSARTAHGAPPGLLLSRGGDGGRGFWTQNLVYQKWPDQIFPIVNFVFSHDGHFGLGRGGGGFGGGGAWFLIILKKPCAPLRHLARGSRCGYSHGPLSGEH